MALLTSNAIARAGKDVSMTVLLIHVTPKSSLLCCIAPFTARSTRSSYATKSATTKIVSSHKWKFSRLGWTAVRRERTRKAVPTAASKIKIRRRSLFRSACWNAMDFSRDCFNTLECRQDRSEIMRFNRDEHCTDMGLGIWINFQAEPAKPSKTSLQD